MDHNFEPVLDTFGELPPFVFESQIEDPFAISTFDFLDSDYDPLEEPVDETIDWFQTYFTNGQFPATIEHEPTESLQALHSWPDPTAAALDRGQTTPATTPEDSPAIPGRMDGADQQLTMPADKNCPEFVPQPRRKQPSEAAREILEEALKLELYPDKTETQKIAERAQMSFKQVRDWFRNQRRRRPLQRTFEFGTPIACIADIVQNYTICKTWSPHPVLLHLHIKVSKRWNRLRLLHQSQSHRTFLSLFISRSR